MASNSNRQEIPSSHRDRSSMRQDREDDRITDHRNEFAQPSSSRGYENPRSSHDILPEEPDEAHYDNRNLDEEADQASRTSEAQLHNSRRPSLVEYQELDQLLVATEVEFRDRFHLPLTARNLRHLSPLASTYGTVTDKSIFRAIVITRDINRVPADHVLAALDGIRGHCLHLVVLSNVQTPELGDISRREEGDVATANAWVTIINRFYNLRTITFVHPAEEQPNFRRGTFAALRIALASNRDTEDIDLFSSEASRELMEFFD